MDIDIETGFYFKFYNISNILQQMFTLGFACFTTIPKCLIMCITLNIDLEY